jgi:hypothetical protein
VNANERRSDFACGPAVAARTDLYDRGDTRRRSPHDVEFAVPGSHGRIGCTLGEVLVLGNTHQCGWREVLVALAGLPYVVRIDEAYFE